jgi:hypothetical protein
MRVLMIGGTKFIGRRITEQLTRLSGPVNQPHSFEHDW